MNEFAAAVTARPTPSPAAAWVAAGNFQIAAHFFGQPDEVRQASGVLPAVQEGGQEDTFGEREKFCEDKENTVEILGRGRFGQQVSLGGMGWWP